METAKLIHKWEAAGLGQAPFRLVGFAAFAAPTMAEANPVAYMNANAEASRTLSAFGVCGGMCDVCGMALMNNYVIRSADKKHFVVGCDCVAKTGDAGLVDAVKLADRKRARAKKEAARLVAWEAARPAREERNARIERYNARMAEIDAEATGARVEYTGWLADALRDQSGDFCRSLRAELLEGRSFADKSPRVRDILGDIYTKGTRGKAREAAREAFESRWDEMETAHERIDTEAMNAKNAEPNPYRE